MDSDMLLKKRFDEFIPEHGFATFNECWGTVLLQAAFLIGEQGNSFCEEVFSYYKQRHFLLPDGSFDMLISPKIMVMVAEKREYKREDIEQHLGEDVVIYPGCYVSPCKKIQYPEAFACHQVYGSWRKHRFGRKVERFLKHAYLVIRFALFKR